MLPPESADALRLPTINNHGAGPQNTKTDDGDQTNYNAGGPQINNSKFFLCMVNGSLTRRSSLTRIVNSPTAQSRNTTEAEEKQG